MDGFFIWRLQHLLAKPSWKRCRTPSTNKSNAQQASPCAQTHDGGWIPSRCIVCINNDGPCALIATGKRAVTPSFGDDTCRHRAGEDKKFHPDKSGPERGGRKLTRNALLFADLAPRKTAVCLHQREQEAALVLLPRQPATGTQDLPGTICKQRALQTGCWHGYLQKHLYLSLGTYSWCRG